jgi:hypothetical protein
MEMVVADKEKRMRRQREIWTQKAAESRDVIASALLAVDKAKFNRF